MNSPAIYNTTFASLKDTDAVSDATQRMLADRVSDLPVIDAAGALAGLFRLDQLYAALLPKAALLGDGLADLAFVSDTVAQLREKMREIETHPVREFTVKADHVVHPDTTPLQVILLLHHGANNIPVVAPDSGKLVAMVSARDILVALCEGGRV